MERVSFDIERQDIADALRVEAEARGRTVEEELAALVERTYVPIKAANDDRSDDWVSELIHLANGAELVLTARSDTFHVPPEL